MKVFLGGTCNESTWRDDLIKALKINYFNPVVEDWTPDCQQEEFTKGQIKSLNQVGRMVSENGGMIFGNLLSVAMFLNRK